MLTLVKLVQIVTSGANTHSLKEYDPHSHATFIHFFESLDELYHY